MQRAWLATGATIAGLALAVVTFGTPHEVRPAPRGSTVAASREAPAPQSVSPRQSEAPELGPHALRGVYRVEFRHQLSFAGEAALSLLARGQLDVTVDDLEHGYRVEQRYRFEVAVHVPAEVRVVGEFDGRGNLLRLGLPTASVEARNLGRALWSASDVRWPLAAKSPTIAPAASACGVGQDRVDFERTAAGSATLTRARQLTALHDGTPLSGPAGKLELRFVAAQLRSLTGSDLRIATPSGGELRASTSLSWERIDGQPVRVAADLRWETEPRLEAVAAAEPQQPDLPTLLQALERAVRMGPAREVPALFGALAERLRAHPEEVELALRAVRDLSLPLGMRGAVVDALGTSGTPAAQRGLLTLLDDDLPGLDGNLYLALGDQAQPLPAASERLGADAQSSALRGAWARVAAGVQLARAEQPAATLREDLLRSLEAGAPLGEVLEALAQSGDPILLELLAPGERDPDPTLRARAAEALRNVPDERADRRLLALSHDADRRVARAALDALEVRPRTVAATERALALLGDPTLHADAHRALRGWAQRAQPVDPQLEAHLRRASAYTCLPATSAALPREGDSK